MFCTLVIHEGTVKAFPLVANLGGWTSLSIENRNRSSSIPGSLQRMHTPSGYILGDLLLDQELVRMAPSCYK